MTTNTACPQCRTPVTPETACLTCGELVSVTAQSGILRDI